MPKRTVGSLYRRAPLLLCLVFFLVQLYLHAQIPLFGDDYYYASYIKQGWNYFVNETVFHYMETNGRAVIHFVDELLLGITPWLWRVANAAVCTLAAYLTARIAAARSGSYGAPAPGNLLRALAVSLCLFCLLPLSVTRQSAYWATGSLNYLWPAVMVLALFFGLRRFEETGKGKIWLPVLAFFAGFSTEQSGIVAVGVGLYLVLETLVLRREKPNATHWAALAAAGAGFLFLLLAPGNEVRTGYYPDYYAMSLVERVIHSTARILKGMFSADTLLPYAALAAVAGGFSAAALWKKKGTLRLLSLGGMALSVAALVCIVLEDQQLSHPLPPMLLYAPMLAAFGWLLVCDGMRLWREKKGDRFFFDCAALVTQLCLIISPEYGPRNMLPTALFLSVSLALHLLEKRGDTLFCTMSAAVTVLLLFDSWLLALLLFAVGLLLAFLRQRGGAELLLAVLLVSMTTVLGATIAGYAENEPIHRENAARTEAYAANPTGTLTLVFPKNLEHRYTLPFDNHYHAHWYKICHGIPTDTEFAWEWPAE